MFKAPIVSYSISKVMLSFNFVVISETNVKEVIHLLLVTVETFVKKWHTVFSRCYKHIYWDPLGPCQLNVS